MPCSSASRATGSGPQPGPTRLARFAEPIGQGRVLRLVAGLGGKADERSPDGLTEREIEVLRLLAAGLSNQEIGAHLHISANTAANHVRSILMKTGAANRTQAAIYAAHHHLVEALSRE